MRYLPFVTAAVLALFTGAAPAGEARLAERDRATLHAEIRAFLLENPEILREMVVVLEAREAEDQAAADHALVAENAERLFNDGFSDVRGNLEASFTVVEFLDYQCGFCRRAHPDVAELIARDGDIRLITKETPILGPGSELAARAAIATLIAEGAEAYAHLGDRLMATEGPITDASLDAALADAGLVPAAVRAGMDAPEVTRRLEETRALAEDLGVQGTPTFVFEETLVRGYIPLVDMEALVADLREERQAAE